MAEFVEHEDGVYIGLRMDRYQHDSALGSGGIKLCANNPVKWHWKSRFNTIEPQPIEVEAGERGAYRLGTAMHVAVLDGTDGALDVYEAAYGIMPSASTHPQALVTDKDVIAKLAEMHLPTGGATKGDRVRRLLDADAGIEVLDVLQEAFERSGRVWVTAAEDRRIRLLHRLIMMSPDEVPLVDGATTTLRDAFVGGLSELSVFWTDENGVRQRCRFDKIKPRITLDLKTFADWREDMDFNQGLLREAWLRGYVLQAVHYQEGRHQLRRLVAEGKVFGGSPAQREVLEEIAASDVWAWMWVFCITDGAPIVTAVRPDTSGIHFANAARTREQALAQFIYYREVFGLKPDTMWFNPVLIWQPAESDWPQA